MVSQLPFPLQNAVLIYLSPKAVRIFIKLISPS